MATKTTAVELAAEMTISWLSNPNNRATVNEVSVILRSMYDSVAKLSVSADDNGSNTPTSKHTPAVSIQKSLASPDYILSLIDGKPYKALRRHLTSNGLTPEEYRERYGLKPDYPIVSQSYSELRRVMAKKIGLGQKPNQRSEVQAKATFEASPVNFGRKAKTVTSDKAS